MQNLDDARYKFEEDALLPDVSPEITINDLKAYIESETGVKITDQRIYYNNQELADGSRTLQQCQILEDSMVGMQVRGKERWPHNAGSSRPAQHRPIDPESTRLRILGNPAELAQLRARSPELAAAIQDPVRFRQVFENLHQRQAYLEAERQRREDLLAADPFNEEAQLAIEKIIREEQVMENVQSAVEHNPEGELVFMLSSRSNRSANTGV